jgi:hypothetical protein
MSGPSSRKCDPHLFKIDNCLLRRFASFLPPRSWLSTATANGEDRDVGTQQTLAIWWMSDERARRQAEGRVATR